MRRDSRSTTQFGSSIDATQFVPALLNVCLFRYSSLSIRVLSLIPLVVRCTVVVLATHSARCLPRTFRAEKIAANVVPFVGGFGVLLSVFLRCRELPLCSGHDIPPGRWGDRTCTPSPTRSIYGTRTVCGEVPPSPERVEGGGEHGTGLDGGRGLHEGYRSTLRHTFSYNPNVLAHVRARNLPSGTPPPVPAPLSGDPSEWNLANIVCPPLKES